MEITITETGLDEREENLRMVRESAADVLAGDAARARQLRFGTRGFDPGKLCDFAALGWTMLRLAEPRGGLGMGLSELCAIACEMGRNLTPEPVWQLALALSAHPDTGGLAGAKIILPAFAPFGVSLPQLKGARLSGQVEPILLGGAADAFLVQLNDGFALVEAGADGLSIETRATHDGTHLAWLHFNDVSAQFVEGDPEALREEAALALSAYQLGLAEAAFQITTSYLKDRQQFGRAIGSFQSLQHRMVDLLLELSLARASLEQASESFDIHPEDRDEWRRQVSLARAQSSASADLVTRTAIQLHGGIGYTDEADIGLYLRKAMVLSGLLGSAAFHRARALLLKESWA